MYKFVVVKKINDEIFDGVNFFFCSLPNLPLCYQYFCPKPKEKR